MNGIQKGRYTEQYVHEHLPGSLMLNEHGERKLPFDIEWNGIRIDVKSNFRITSDLGRCSFSVKKDKKLNGTIYVYVGVDSEANQKYLWVSKMSRKMRTSFHLADAITEHLLPDEVLRWNSLEIDPVEEYFVPSFRSISIREEDFKLLEKARDRIIKESENTTYPRYKLSISETFMLVMAEHESRTAKEVA